MKARMLENQNTSNLESFNFYQRPEGEILPAALVNSFITVKE
jgi:hypothetical protein